MHTSGVCSNELATTDCGTLTSLFDLHNVRFMTRSKPSRLYGALLATTLVVTALTPLTQSSADETPQML